MTKLLFLNVVFTAGFEVMLEYARMRECQEAVRDLALSYLINLTHAKSSSRPPSHTRKLHGTVSQRLFKSRALPLG